MLCAVCCVEQICAHKCVCSDPWVDCRFESSCCFSPDGCNLVCFLSLGVPHQHISTYDMYGREFNQTTGMQHWFYSDLRCTEGDRRTVCCVHTGAAGFFMRVGGTPTPPLSLVCLSGSSLSGSHCTLVTPPSYLLWPCGCGTCQELGLCGQQSPADMYPCMAGLETAHPSCTSCSPCPVTNWPSAPAANSALCVRSCTPSGGDMCWRRRVCLLALNS